MGGEREGRRDGGRDGGMEGGRDGGREGWREGGREGGMEGWRAKGVVTHHRGAYLASVGERNGCTVGQTKAS